MTDAPAFDNRLLSVSIEVLGEIHTFNQDFWLKVKGCKFANQQQNEATIEISNLDAPTRNYLLTETSPFNAITSPKTVTVSAGRVSTGLFALYTGNVKTSKITQPPDIRLELKCGTLHAKKGSVGSRSGGKVAQLSTLAHAVAGNLGLTLRNEAPPASVANYAYSGNALSETQAIAEAGNCQCYVDDETLVLKSVALPLSGSVLNLSRQTGMIGLPEITDKGLKVKFLYDGSVKLGGAIQITSTINPAANGLFVIYKLGFDLASREKEFYYEAECLKAAT